MANSRSIGVTKTSLFRVRLAICSAVHFTRVWRARARQNLTLYCLNKYFWNSVYQCCFFVESQSPHFCGLSENFQLCSSVSRNMYFPCGWPRVLHSDGESGGNPVKVFKHRTKELIVEIRERSVAFWHARVRYR